MKFAIATAHCPKCIIGEAELVELVMTCKKCGWSYDPDERAFTKLRNNPDGLIKNTNTKLKRGRPKKVNPQKGKPNGKVYGDKLSQKVVEHYRNTDDTILQTAKIFGMSQTTAGRIIKACEAL